MNQRIKLLTAELCTYIEYVSEQEAEIQPERKTGKE